MMVFVLASEAIKCYVGFSDGVNPPTQFEDDCGSGVKYCGTIFDPTGGDYIA
jgi:hypothetical protein